MKKSLLEQAKNVLDNNFQLGGFTIPSKGLYPFQWKWDSGFISIGYAHYDIDKAKKELSWYPKTSLEEGLDKTINWFKEFF